MGELDRRVGFRSDRLRLPQSQLVSAAGHRSVKSACRKHAASHCQPEHRARPALRLQEHQQWCARIRVLRNAAYTVWNLETFVEYLPRPRQLGPPPGPHGGRAAPRIPPARAADNTVGDAAGVSTRRGQEKIRLQPDAGRQPESTRISHWWVRFLRGGPCHQVLTEGLASCALLFVLLTHLYWPPERRNGPR